MTQLSQQIFNEIKRSMVRDGIRAALDVVKQYQQGGQATEGGLILDDDAGVGLNLKDGAELVYIPGGAFMMGPSEQAVSNVLPGFWIYKYPVTVAQYRRYFKESFPRLFANDPNTVGHRKPPWGWQDNHPMVSSDYPDPTKYARWAGVRLPYTMEWEKAARGNQDARRFPWGDEWDVTKCRCFTEEIGDTGGTTGVATYTAGVSPFGVYDMVGNAYECCLHPETNEVVAGGGSWTNNVDHFFEIGYWADPFAALAESFDRPHVGFRCAWS